VNGRLDLFSAKTYDTSDTMNDTKSTDTKKQTESALAALFTALTQPLTKNHSDLIFTVEHLGKSSFVNVRQVHADDYGQLVGTAGVTINAFKTLIAALGVRYERRGVYTLNKNLVGIEGERAKFRANPDFDSEPLRALLGAVLTLYFSTSNVIAENKGDATVLSAKVSKTEPMCAYQYEISDALGTIFRAIGKAQGRNEVFVELNAA